MWIVVLLENSLFAFNGIEKAKTSFSSLIFFLFFLPSFIGCSGNNNILKAFSIRNENKILYSDAQVHLDRGECQEAVELFDKLPESFLADREVNFVHSHAYACRFGMETLFLLTRVRSPLLKSLMTFYRVSSDSHIKDGEKAMSLILDSYGTPEERLLNENLYLAFLSLSQVGLILSFTADEDNNAELDEGFDACSQNSLTQKQIIDIGVAMAHSFLSFQTILGNLTEQVKANVEEVFNLFQKICDSFQRLITDQNPNLENPESCFPLNREEYNPLHIRMLRSLIHEKKDFGVGSCENENLEDCLC